MSRQFDSVATGRSLEHMTPFVSREQLFQIHDGLTSIPAVPSCVGRPLVALAESAGMLGAGSSVTNQEAHFSVGIDCIFRFRGLPYSR